MAERSLSMREARDRYPSFPHTCFTMSIDVVVQTKISGNKVSLTKIQK